MLTLDLLVGYAKAAIASQIGQALLAGLRVLLATVVALWVNAGMPVSDLTMAMLGDWVELGIQAGAALVIANYFGPWEKRYGLNKD